MVDPARPPEPAIEPGAAAPEPGAPALVPEAASPDPGALAAEPEAASPDPKPDLRAYALPTPRHVVGSGLALALASTSELRRASIYIGLLVLGAFGPSIVALLLVLGRLGEQAGDALGPLFGELGAPPQPALEAALLVVMFDALFGLLLFVSISIDAQVIAVSLLGGRAGERPLQLWEAIRRARQTFWRMAGAGTLVGLVSLLIQSFIVAALGGFSRSDEATSVAGALLATLVTAPLAYVTTSIVLGDVGAMEALSRSWRLFAARRLLGVVVVLFTLLTSAIHLFAFSAGLDIVARAADLLQVSLTEGAVQFGIATLLILAAVVAYGSLTFTIGAVVSAPQVTGFLGLTFYSGGLDRARGDGPRPPRGFRYVSTPMALAMLGLGGLVALEIPAINSIPAPVASETLRLLRDAAAAESDAIVVSGFPLLIEDPAGDAGSGPAADVDITRAELAYIEAVPAWLAARFDCAAVDVACGRGTGAGSGSASGSDDFAEGALLFLHRLAAPLAIDQPRRVAALVSLENEIRVPAGEDATFAGASRVFVTTFADGAALTGLRTSGFDLRPIETAARSTWHGSDVYTLVPLRELPFAPTGWGAVVIAGAGTGSASRDVAGGGASGTLEAWDWGATIFIDDLRTGAGTGTVDAGAGSP